MPYAEMAAYRAAVMMPWDLNLVMFHVAQTKRHDTHWGMVITPIDLGLPSGYVKIAIENDHL